MTRAEILAMPAGWELDALVAEKCLRLQQSKMEHYSTDLNIAWDALAVKYAISISSSGPFHEVTNEKLAPKYLRVVYDPVFNKLEPQGDFISLAEAICKAALLAELCL